MAICLENAAPPHTRIARRGDGNSNVTRGGLALEHAQHRGVSRALKVVDQIADARCKPISIDLHRRKLCAKCRQAFSEGLAQMFEASAIEMCCCPRHRGPAKTQCDRRCSEVKQWKHDLQHRLEAAAVVGELETGFDFAVIEHHGRGGVGAHP